MVATSRNILSPNKGKTKWDGKDPTLQSTLVSPAQSLGDHLSLRFPRIILERGRREGGRERRRRIFTAQIICPSVVPKASIISALLASFPWHLKWFLRCGDKRKMEPKPEPHWKKYFEFVKLWQEGSVMRESWRRWEGRGVRPSFKSVSILFLQLTT